MPKELISTFEVLWQTAMEHAEKQLAAIKTDLQVQQEKATTEKILAEIKTTVEETNKKLDEKTNQLQAIQTELAVTQERLSIQMEEKEALKNQYENRLKQGYNEQQALREKTDSLQAATTPTRRPNQKTQASLAQARQLQEQSESRWLNLIDQARTESKELQKNHENTLNKQQKQIETGQATLEELKNKNSAQQAALNHAQTVAMDLKKQLN